MGIMRISENREKTEIQLKKVEYMICRKCGRELQKDWIRCPYCGQPVKNTEPPVKRKKAGNQIYKKWWFWTILVIVIFLMFAVVGLLKEKESVSQEPVKTEEKQEFDFTQTDFQDLIGKSEAELEAFGLKKGGDDSIYTAVKGAVQVTCKDGKVNKITLAGNSEKTPSFCGVRLGSEEAEAYTKFKESYPEEKIGTDGKIFVNPENGGRITCKSAGGKITRIEYKETLTEEAAKAEASKEKVEKEEKADENSAEYIFPDSDKKYLSEEEIRSLSADKLYIGRNEVFARHGYIFKDPNLKQHFESTSWYQGTVTGDQFNMSVFNEYERKNVELIKAIEDEMNGQ